MSLLRQRALGLFALLGLGFVLTGCVIAIGTGRESTSPPPVIVTDSADAATVAEIDAAARLHMDDDKAAVLAQIAERTGLSTTVQVHLVNVAYRSLSFDDNKTRVLAKIVARPDFNDATRHAVVSQLQKLSFDSNRQQVLRQINERLQGGAAH